MPPEVVQDNDQKATKAALRERLGRLAAPLDRLAAWAASHRWKAVLLFGGCTTLLAAAIALLVGLATAGRFERSGGVDAALAALDEGRYADARRLAESLRSQRSPTLEVLGASAFVLGAATAAEAAQSYSGDRPQQYLVAAGYLDEAYDRGFPPGREAEGLYLLGKCLNAGGQYPQSRPVLREALKQNPRHAAEIHRLLGAAYLNDANPDFAKALEHNSQLLADRMLLPHERHRGLLERARILLHLDRQDECLAALDAIPEEAGSQAEAMVIRSQILMREAAALRQEAADEPDRQVEALTKYQEAVKLLRVAQSRDTLSAQVSGQAMYLIGVCFLEVGDDRAAWAQLDRTKRTYPGTPEAAAADFRLAELARKLGNDAEALAAYQRVLRTVCDPRAFHNRWLTLDQLQTGLMEAYRDYLEAAKFEPALALAKLFYPTFSRTRTLELVAQAYRAWGAARLAAAAHLPPAAAEPLRSEGRRQLRRAGSVYRRLAEIRAPTRQYPEDLWASADCFLAGASFTGAVEMFEQYLRNESRARRPRALLGLGEARLALGRTEEAIDALRECIEFHSRDAAAFRARLVAAGAYVEKGEVAEAERLLAENLSGDWLAPDSAEWRESLFALGQLLHTEGRYEEATARLEEVVARFPDEPATLEARYMVGHCYFARAAENRQKLKDETVPHNRTLRAEKIRQQLTFALDWFRRAEQALLDRQQAAGLSDEQSSTLRNCSFAVGSVLFDLDRYEEAIQAYLAAAGRYKDSPSVLEAYVQMARSFRRLDRPSEAQAAVEQAKAALARLSAEDQFAATTLCGRQQWTELLDELEEELRVKS